MTVGKMMSKLTKLERLTLNYMKKRKRTLFDDVFLKLTPEDIYIERLQRFFSWLNKRGLIRKKEELEVMDMIDFSKMNDRSMYNKSSDLPAFQVTEDDKKKITDCWYLIIPPFEEGVLKINKNRYIRYTIQKINEKEHSYTAYLEDYAYDHNVWMMDSKSIDMAYWKDNKLTYKTAGNLGSTLMENTLNKHEAEWDADNLLYFRQVAIPVLKSVEEKDDLDILFTHFFVAICKTNIQLAESKPKAIRGSGKQIKTGAGELDKNPKPKIVRTTSGGIRLISVKPPKAPSEETIRKYKIEAWKTRGHVRHYKSGKTTWVKESVHHRKCLRTDEESKLAQTIIVAS